MFAVACRLVRGVPLHAVGASTGTEKCKHGTVATRTFHVRWSAELVSHVWRADGCLAKLLTLVMRGFSCRLTVWINVKV